METMEEKLWDNSSSDGDSSSISNDVSWIGSFISQPGYEFLTKVPKEFITEKGNLIDLNEDLDDYEESLMTIMDADPVHVEQSNFSPPSCRNIYKLFALIHARYIITIQGINQMAVRFQYGEFGFCPRFFCNNQKVLPIGLSEEYGNSFVKIYCPRCADVYEPVERYSNLDGAFFGTTFPEMFFMNMPNLRPIPSTRSYVPMLYGFKISKSAYEPLPQSSTCHDEDKENTNPNQKLVENKNPNAIDIAEEKPNN